MSDAPSQPHNIEAEQAILGALLLNNEVFERVSHLLSAEVFFDPVHGRIWAAAEGRIRNGALATPVTLRPFLEKDEGLAELGGIAYLARLVEATISITAAKEYAEQLRELWNRRRIIAEAETLIARASDWSSEDTTDNMVAEAEAAMSGLADDVRRERPWQTMAQALRENVREMNEAYQGKPQGVSTGVAALDRVLGPIRNDDMVVIAGRPSMGKSGFAIEIARRMAKAGVGIVVWSGEMLSSENAARALAAEHAELGGQHVPYFASRQGRVSEGQLRGLFETTRGMTGLPIYFVRSDINDMRELRQVIGAACRNHRRQGRERVAVFLDYMQQATLPGGSRYERITEISQQTKALGMQVGAPIFALSQLSRKCEERIPPRPSLADLRESGQIEQDAQKVILLYRESYYLERDTAYGRSMDDDERADRLAASRGILECIVPKNRGGPITEVEVGFDPAVNLVTDLATGRAMEGAYG